MSDRLPVKRRIELVGDGTMHPSKLDMQFNIGLRRLGEGSPSADERILDRLMAMVEVTERFFDEVPPDEFGSNDYKDDLLEVHPPTPRH